MKIYTNENYEIKAINSSTDKTLKEVEVDRIEVFGNMSDFMLLNYCYKQDKTGYSVYPASNYSKLVEEDYKIKIDKTQKKVSILEQENKELKKEISQIQLSIVSLVSAISEK